MGTPDTEPSTTTRALWAQAFIRTLFQSCPTDLYVDRRWWRGQSISQRWDHPDAMPPWEYLVPTLDQFHVFVGVAARQVPGDGGRANCALVPAVFVDADLSTHEAGSAFARKLKTFPLPPSLLVRSGSGYGCHAYWLLDPPHRLMLADGSTDTEAEQAWQRVQIGLAQHFNSDPSMKDLPRVMRVPGTRNVKPGNGPGAIVRLLICEQALRYPLSAFDQYRAAESDLPHAPKLTAREDSWRDPDDPDAVVFRSEFGRRGWLLSDQGGGLYYVRCPWADQHSSAGNASSTAIWVPETPGWPAGFRCLHAHCDRRRAREVYEFIRLQRAAETIREEIGA